MREQGALHLHTAWFVLAATCLAALAYYPGLQGDYAFDDIPNLLNNQKLHIESLDLESLAGASFSSGSGVLYRPLSMASFALNYYFFGEAPLSLKVTNLLIHVLNGVGLFLLGYLLLTFFHRRATTGFSTHHIPWLAALIALLWVIHPINLTSVLYIVQRMTSLSALFMIYGMVFYVWYRDRLFHREGKLALLLGGSIFFTVAATLSKENGALLPLILLLLELLFFRLKNADEQFDKGITVSFTLLVVIPFAVVTTWYLFNIDMFAVGYAIRDFTLPERLMTEARAVCYYLQLIVLPSIDELALFHDNFAISRSLNDPPTTLAAVVALTSLLALAVYLARRAPLFSFGILMFFVSHLLESTSLPLELLHEHRNYLGSYGIILSITTLALTVLYRLNSRILIKVIPVLVLLTFSGMTHLRANEWKSNVSLALSEAARNPDSPRATYAAARIYANLVTAGESHLTQQALQRLEIAKQVNTNNISADVALLLFVSRIGLPIEDMWLDQLHYKIAHHPITPSSVAFLKNLVICNRYDCDIPAETLDQLFKAGRNNEFLLRTGKIKADYLTVYADFALNNLGDQELAERLFEEAISIDPAEPQYRINYIRLLVATRRPEEAREHIGALSRLNTFGQLSATIQELNDSIPRTGNAMPTVDQNNMHSRRSHAQPDLRYDY